MNKTLLTLTFGGLIALGTACSSSGNSNGRSGVPDEFRVVKKAPLTVPPEYSLRPPELGTVRPIEVDPERRTQVLAFGTDIGVDASAVERMLVARAGAIAVSPIIRDTIDYEEAGVLRKGRPISEAVTGFTGSAEEVADAASDNATGGEEVKIERGNGRRIKLPGT